MDIQIIGVVGAGQMGSGITEVVISAGFRALMRDISPEALEKGKKRITTDLERRVQKGKITAEEQKRDSGATFHHHPIGGFQKLRLGHRGCD